MGFYAERVFPWMLDRMAGIPVVEELTRQALAPLQGDICEIGFGSGRTLPFYPHGVTSLSAAEPSPGMTRRADARIKAAPFPVRLDLLAGENLPYADASFDGVTFMLVLCTVDDPARVAAEAFRVLKPGGMAAFMEHGQSADAGWRRWQDRLNPVQRVVGCGCNLNRDPVTALKGAGFHVSASGPTVYKAFPGIPQLTPITIGTAVKPLDMAA